MQNKKKIKYNFPKTKEKKNKKKHILISVSFHNSWDFDIHKYINSIRVIIYMIYIYMIKIIIHKFCLAYSEKKVASKEEHL